MELFDKKKEEPRIASDARVKKTYVERKCPSCYEDLVQERQEKVVYEFAPDKVADPSKRIVELWKAQYGCGKCNFHNDLWLHDGTGWIPVTEEDFRCVQSDGVKTNPETLKQYLQFLRIREPTEAVRKNVQKFFSS